MMKRLIAVLVAMAAITFMTQSNASAQDFLGGYRFGAGVRANCGLGLGLQSFQREQPPYFAQFPPVYYSHIVKRPYGISPFAAPAGIAPVEMNYAAPKVEPITKVNPFFKQEVSPVSDETQATKESKDKVTWKANPFYSLPTGIAAK